MKKHLFTLFLGMLALGFLSGCGGGGGGTFSAGGGTVGASASLVSIELSPVDPAIASGTTTQLSATGIYSDHSKKDLTASVEWNSSDTAVARVDRGLAGAFARGSATIEAACGGISGRTTLTVTDAVLVSIQVTPVSAEAALGSTRPFTAMGVFSDGSVQNLTEQADWSVTDGAVVSVSNEAGSRGVASAAGIGATTVSATLDGVTGTAELTVTSAALVSILVTPADSRMAKGTTQQFFAMGVYSDHSIQDLTAQAAWSSSDARVADISSAAGSRGLSTALSIGATVMKAELGSVSGTTNLNVTPAALAALKIDPASPAIRKATSLQFVATGTYSDSSTQDLTAQVVWSSSDACVANISNAAGTSGLASAVGAGTSTIQAASGSISAAAILTVTSGNVDDAIEALRRQIRDLDPGAFKNVNSRHTLLNKLDAVVAALDAGDCAAAAGQLRNDILAKTDGCAHSGAPDSNDWIVDCPSQALVYPLVLDAIDAVISL